ncbi:MAG: glycosyltransferase [Pseudomonadota bacterium]
MSGMPRVSVIVVSHGRPALLLRCLQSLRYQYFENFEIVVVADRAGAAAIRASRFRAYVKLSQFEDQNISQARNLGLACAAGELVAFIDDDAAAEPTWLGHLVAAFEEPGVGSATGFVLGRNGISFQWKARTISARAEHADILVPENRTTFHAPPNEGGAVKVEGTNCAFRRAALDRIGGFDSAIRFYLDESDISLRLAASGYATAVVPMAQVHHGFAASARRTWNRAPRSLFEIGASLAVFLGKHGNAHLIAERVSAERYGQRVRLLRHMQLGTLTPGDVPRLLRSFDQGVAAGRGRTSVVEKIPSARDFRRCPTIAKPGGTKLLAGYRWQKRRLLRKSIAVASDGTVVTVFLASLFPFRHKVQFLAEGVWLHSGGLMGRSRRDRSSPRCLKPLRRLEWENARLRGIRDLLPAKAED